MVCIREIEVYLKGNLRNPVIHKIYVPTKVLLEIFGPKVFDQLRKSWIDDDFQLIWMREITKDQANKLAPFIAGQIDWDFKKYDYFLNASDYSDESDLLEQAQHINDFMSWFVQKEELLARGYEQESIRNTIDGPLEKIDARLGWEIGSDDTGALYFAISPNLDAEVLPVLRQLVNVSTAYRLKHFTFRIGRRRRCWAEVMQSVQSKSASYSQVDLWKWKYLVFRLPNSELFDIVFSCGENCSLSDQYHEDFVSHVLKEIAYLIAGGLLGEMFVLERVNQIKVVKTFDGDSSAQQVQWLPYAFEMEPL